MSRRLTKIAGTFALVFALGALTFGQTPQTQTTTTVTTQKTQAVQNSDGSWTVVEFPADKEVMVNLTPATSASGATTATGTAKVMRMKDHTMINLNLSGLATDMSGLNLYAVDPSGVVTMLGPVQLNNGAATQTFTTPLNKFMLVLSPEGNLTSIAPNTNVAFRSAAPQGFAVLPMSSSGRRDGAAVGERVAATSTSGATPAYGAPLLGIPSWRKGTDTQMRINFAGELTGSRANVFIEPRKDGATTIKMRFHELKEAPGGKRYVLWAIGPNNDYHRLGQVVNTGQRNEAQIQTETGLTDFGLFITTEDVNDPPPSGTVVGTVVMDKTTP